LGVYPIFRHTHIDFENHPVLEASASESSNPQHMAGLVGGTVAKSPQSMTHCRVLQERPEILVVGLCLWQIPNLHIIIHICSHIHYDCFNVEPFFGGLMNSMEVIFRQMVVSFTLLLLGGLDLHILQHGDSNL